MRSKRDLSHSVESYDKKIAENFRNYNETEKHIIMTVNNRC